MVESSDGAYDGLSIKGFAVPILDNDAIGYINVIESRAVNILTEDTDDSFTCKVFPTRVPDQGEQVVVLVVSQNDKDGNPYLTLERDEAEPTSEDAVSLKFTPDTDFATVGVKHNSAAVKLKVADESLLIRLSNENRLTTDLTFKDQNQSIKPVTVRLLPGLDSPEGKTIAVVQPTGQTMVVEGSTGSPGRLEDSYDIYLRPYEECHSEFGANRQQPGRTQYQQNYWGRFGL